MQDLETIDCELAVIGAGIAGMAAAMFASNRGIATVQIGRTGEIAFASGLIDVMGVHPQDEKRVTKDPWAAIEALADASPGHPYARLGKKKIVRALDEAVAFFEESGLHYQGYGEENLMVPTPAGTLKPTYLVPSEMWNGVQSLRAGTPCAIVGFEGLKGFSPPQITTVLQHQWPGLRPVWISFPTPASSSDIYAEGLALRFDLPEERRLLADLLRPNIVDAGAVGLPAVLGIYRSKQALEELESALGLPVFEIPTTPPSVPGIRLKEAFASGLRRNGVRLFHQFRVLEVSTAPGVKFHLAVGRQNPEVMIRAPGVILATGRFLGGGLHAGRSGIRETIFDLPVKQPEDRELWHRVNPMDPRGHPVNQAGLEVDQSFRPLKNGRPAFENVYAAGSILAHQDWMRMKCGSGLSIATAFGAVEAFRTARRSEP